MIVVGLTGSIGMGKSTTANMFRRLGIPLHDSDAVVHAMMRPGGEAVAPIAAAFPEAVREGAVDRPALGARVFGDPVALRRLESIVHPLVGARTRRFLRQSRRHRRPIVVLDVPLLLEGSSHLLCDLVAVVSAPGFIQRQRVMARPGMTAQRLASILAKQMPDAEKRRRADRVIHTGLGRAYTMRSVKRLVTGLRRGLGDGKRAACGKSCSIRRRRVSTLRPATGS
ncbi:dephospho-CoA kinase [Thalassobaculum sp. OXR-137]|uniref:dephospho-CoA kinase n=1 Tax=Thalassobaculum sp. OXR-137 TaxID=3100173 RepID=UPI002AC972EB|nr:dephospho-CoA kinase [Thalassobaculum sp. OXR-137]WPZ35493.1 dephospho-CoA kinase [Thalassobaculum sp. OXR-137]